MSRASLCSTDHASVFERASKRFVASLTVPSPLDNEMRPATQQEPEKLKVMAYRSSDGSSCFSAEVPFGPFRTCPLTTEAVAAPLHPLHVAPDKPTVVAPNAREHIEYMREKRGDSQPRYSALHSCSTPFCQTRSVRLIFVGNQTVETLRPANWAGSCFADRSPKWAGSGHA
jgi:hypothetical protein